jgi:hypothetical protein
LLLYVIKIKKDYNSRRELSCLQENNYHLKLNQIEIFKEEKEIRNKQKRNNL